MNIPSILLRGIVAIARAIGRWVIMRLGEYGRVKLVHYMEGRIDVFQDRLERARSNRRRRWLTGRINRWLKAIAWLRSHAKKLTKKLAKLADGYLKDKGYELSARGEKYSAKAVRKAKRKARRALRRAAA
jgi:hypothetical protein